VRDIQTSEAPLQITSQELLQLALRLSAQQKGLDCEIVYY